MGDVTFRRCKNILCHDQYTCFVHLHIGLLAQGWKKRDFCGGDGLFFFCSSLFYSGK